MPYNYIATTAFGIESTVKREVQKLGFNITSSFDGKIEFSGDLSLIPKANIWLRSADRVLLKMGEFEAFSFDELFEKTKALPWGDFITSDAKFTVTGKSVKSQLYSVPDCQSIVKKAVVEKLKQKYGIEYFQETGAEYKIQVALLKNIVTLTIDTTGAGLHKRGYRISQVSAPMKETMAHALIELSYWRKDRTLLDPFCGSGTIPIETALMSKNIAPGLYRKFASDKWPQIPKKLWKEVRTAAAESIDKNFTPQIYASDIDPKAIEFAKKNAEKAGVADCINFSVTDLKDLYKPTEYGIVITNPPYGERIGEITDIRRLYSTLSQIFKDDPKWSLYLITADEEFEKIYAKKADAKRKLFTGMIKTDYYQFFGKKPS